MASKSNKKWTKFKAAITTTPKKSAPKKTTPKKTTPVKTYKVKVTADVLNVRKGAGTKYGIVTQIKKNEVYTIVQTSNGWGKLKSGAGWISLAYTKRA